jgi:hypothetical protein
MELKRYKNGTGIRQAIFWNHSSTSQNVFICHSGKSDLSLFDTVQDIRDPVSEQEKKDGKLVQIKTKILLDFKNI